MPRRKAKDDPYKDGQAQARLNRLLEELQRKARRDGGGNG